MFDKIVEIGAGFDVITPVFTIIQDIGHGGGHRFAVSRDCGKSGRDVTRLLKAQGIKTWGHMVISDTILFTTRKQDAPQAQSILVANGITPESPAPKGYKQESGKGKQGYQPGEGWRLFG